MIEKIRSDGEAEKAALAKETKLAETKAEGEKLQGEIDQLEKKIQDKKDAGCIRSGSLSASKEVLSRDSSAVESVSDATSGA